MRPHPPPTLGHNMPMHERRASSHSMQSDMSSHSMNRNFLSSNGRGRGGFAPQPPQQSYGISSPATASRQMSNPRAASAHLSGGPQFSAMPPGSPFNRGRHSPAIHPATPNMANIAPQQYLHGNAPMYPNYSHMGAGHHPVCGPSPASWPHFHNSRYSLHSMPLVWWCARNEWLMGAS